MKNNRSKIIICIVTVLMWFSIYSYQSIFSPYLKLLGISSFLIGLITGVYGLVQMILRIPFGILSDRLKTQKLFITAGISFTFLSAMLLLVSDNPYVILLARAFAGISASTWVNFIVLFSSYYAKEEAVGSVGTLNFYSNAAQISGMTLGIFFASSLGNIHYTFIIALVSGIAGFILSFSLTENKEIYKNAVPINLTDLKSVITDRTLLFVSFIGMVSQLITFGTILSFTPVYASEILGISTLQNSILTVLSYLPIAVTSLFIGKILLKKFREKSLVITGMLILSVCTLIIPFTPNYGSLIAVQIVSGVGKGMSFPLLMGLSIKNIDAAKRGTAMGIFQAVYGFGMFFGPAITGVISSLVSVSVSFVLLGSLCLITSAAAIILFGRKNFLKI